MTINLQELREQIAGYLGGGGEAFDEAFLFAAKRVTSDVNRQCDQSVTLPSSVSEQLDLDENQYLNVYSDGITHYMQMSGEWVRERNLPDSKRRYERELAMAQFHAITEADPEVGYPERE